MRTAIKKKCFMNDEEEKNMGVTFSLCRIYFGTNFLHEKLKFPSIYEMKSRIKSDLTLKKLS